MKRNRTLAWWAFALVAGGVCLLLESLSGARQAPELSVAEVLAMREVRAAHRVLFAARAERIDNETATELARVDPAETGVIGVEWSPLVTTQGNYEAKALSADPLWAALFLRWFERAEMEPGDRVAIGASGSFPGMLLSARIAAETAGFEPVIVGSLGASNFGATVPVFDLWHMEETLLDTGMIRHGMKLLTPGGDGDALQWIEDEDREKVLNRLEEIAASNAEIEVYQPAHLSEAIGRREEILFGIGGVGSDARVKLFVNIGGHAANYGTGATALRLPSGFVEAARAEEIYPNDGSRIGDSVATRALRGGLPIVNVIDLKGILATEAVAMGDARGLEMRSGSVPPPWRGAAALLCLSGIVLLGAARNTFNVRGDSDDPGI